MLVPYLQDNAVTSDILIPVVYKPQQQLNNNLIVTFHTSQHSHSSPWQLQLVGTLAFEPNNDNMFTIHLISHYTLFPLRVLPVMSSRLMETW